MNEKDVRQAISSRVLVTHQYVVIAKSFILNEFNPDSFTLLRCFLEHLQIQPLYKFVLHQSVPTEPQIKLVADFLRWRLAFVEALWALLGEALILPTRSDLAEIDVHQGWTTEVPGSGGRTSGRQFDEYKVALPLTLRLAPSLQGNVPSPLTDPDLFLLEVDIPDIHEEIADALQQAVKCFRLELYLPSVMMLGMASEGAWIELGLSLLKANPSDPRLTSDARDTIRDSLTSPHTSVLQKMESVSDLYKKQDVYANVAKRSGYNIRILSNVFIWSNVIRDSRNAVHYGADSSSRNTYEKVATFLLGTGQNLRVLYAIRRAAEELS